LTLYLFNKKNWKKILTKELYKYIKNFNNILAFKNLKDINIIKNILIEKKNINIRILFK